MAGRGLRQDPGLHCGKLLLRGLYEIGAGYDGRVAFAG